MKNNFGKATALIMGLLMILSGRALAFSSSNQESSHGNAFGESKILIAQNGELSQEDFDAISQLLIEAKSNLGDLQAKLGNVSELHLPGKNALGQMIVDAETVIGNAELAFNNKALTEGDGVALVEQALNLATTVGDICAPLLTTATSEESRAVMECCIQESASLRDIALQIKSIAEAGL